MPDSAIAVSGRNAKVDLGAGESNLNIAPGANLTEGAREVR